MARSQSRTSLRGQVGHRPVATSLASARPPHVTHSPHPTPGRNQDKRPPDALKALPNPGEARRLRRGRGRVQRGHRAAAQIVRHALVLQRRDRHPHPALPVSQQPAGRDLANRTTRFRALTSPVRQADLATYKSVPHHPRSGTPGTVGGTCQDRVITACGPEAAVKFRVGRDALGEAVAWVARALPSRPVVPVLSGLLLRAGDDGLTLSCFDYEVSARIAVEAEVAEPGTVLVPGRLLAEITRSLPQAPAEFSSVA